MSPIHASALTLGVVGIATALLVSGYWAIALGVVGTIMASLPARSGTGAPGQAHIPAVAISILAVVFGVAAQLMWFVAFAKR